MTTNFADRLLDAIDEKQNPSIIGLDSDLALLPQEVRDEASGKTGDPMALAAHAMLIFNKAIIRSIKDIVPAVKIQSAFYEQFGPDGVRAFKETADFAKKEGLLVVGDVKRNDIGNTSRAYSNAYIGAVKGIGTQQPGFDLDCITVNPYLGSDGINPFIEDVRAFGKGIFILVKTSNASSSELQDLDAGGAKVYERVAALVDKWGSYIIGKRGYSSVGAVVGATFPEQAAHLRTLMPRSIFLVPGFGAQGGYANDIVHCFSRDGYGAIIHSARDVIFAYQKAGKSADFAEAARDAAAKMRDGIGEALKQKGLWPW